MMTRVLTAALAAAAAALPSASNLTWTSIRIGGGGYVPGTFFSEATPVQYFKTDVGGAYRRSTSPASPDGIAWQPLLDSLTPDRSEFFSVSHLALDAANGLSVYALLGSLPTWGSCEVWHTTDGGDTWTTLVHTGNWTLACGGNYKDRGVGERLAIHAADNTTLMLAGYDGRVYVTRDGFTSGAQGVHNISLPGNTYPAPNPVRSVAFMPTTTSASSSGAASASAPSYVALAMVPNQGLWLSPGPAYEDPSTWVLQQATVGLGEMSRLLVDPTGPWLYFTTNGSFGRMSLTTASPPVLAMDWQHTPAPPFNFTYGGLAINPSNRQDITFLSLGTDSSTTFMRTLDGGQTFYAVNWTTASSVPWAYNNDYDLKLNAASSINFNPFNASEVWVSDFFGVWRSTDFAGATDPSTLAHFTNSEWGHEEVCYNFVKSPPKGLPLSGVADDFGWRHNNGLDQYPTAVYPTKDAHNCGFHADYTLSLSPDGTAQEAIWLTGGDEYGSCRYGWCGTHHYVGVSYDGGQTFTETAYDAAVQNSNGYPYRIAVHPFNGSTAVITGYEGLPLVYTRDAGVTWANATDVSTGQPLLSVGPWGNFWWAQPLARDNNADPVGSPSTPATLYYYNGTTSLFTSTDSGASWTPTFNGLPPWNTPLFGIATPPRGTAAAGDIWAFAGWQLHHSTNGGVNFTSVWEFYSVKAVIAVGPLPNVTSSKTGRSAAEMSALCAARLPAERRPKPAPRELLAADAAAGIAPSYPVSTSASAAYAVYAVGQVDGQSDRQALYASVDYGQHWVDLTTPTQGLGDSPSVLEASLQTPGLLFVGTDGRGGFYADVSAVLAEALEGCEAEAGDAAGQQ